MTLAGWGNHPRVDCRVLKACTVADLAQIVRCEQRLIARGLGRSYGDAALQPAATVSMLEFNRILSFDQASGRIVCESGVTLADLLAVFVPQGWFPPVTPGTRYVTLGGMVASDVHGKNHHQSGSFAQHVEALDLMLADGHVKRCSPSEDADLFAATCGGMGLTGLILNLTFRLIPIETAWIRQETLRVANLDEMMKIFEDSADWSYTVAWIDCLAKDYERGRGFLHRAEHATRAEISGQDPLAVPTRRQMSVPFDLPLSIVNRMAVRVFNQLYWRYGQIGTKILPYDKFFYPLDAIHNWNRIYGHKGFIQYQCVLPKAESRRGLSRLLTAAETAEAGSFLAVLKLLGAQDGMLSFPMEGYTLALDFPVSGRLVAVLDGFDRIVAEHGGRVYLAKDSRSRPEQIRGGYDRVDQFLKIRNRTGGAGRFSSLLSERLAL